MGAVFNSTGHQLRLPDVVSGHGIYVTTSSAKRYMDLESGVWCLSIGHANERVSRAISSQIEAITHAGFSYSAEVVERAAESILSVCRRPGGSVVLLSSGSEAIDYARQAARSITGGSRTLSFHDTYLGSLSSTLDRSADWLMIDWRYCPACPDGVRSAECSHLDAVPGDVAEFIFEPGSSRGEVRFAPAQLAQRIAERAREAGALVVANEVTTGIGRTGSWFGFDHYGLEPDIIVLGKGLGNGYPVSAVVFDRDTASRLEDSGFRYMQSHQNDPLGAAVAAEVLEVIQDDGLIERAAANGPAFRRALSDLMAYDAVVEVRGRGLMLVVDLIDEVTTSQVVDSLLDRGFIVGNRGSSLRMDPPLSIEREEFMSFVRALDEILASLRIG